MGRAGPTSLPHGAYFVGPGTPGRLARDPGSELARRGLFRLLVLEC